MLVTDERIRFRRMVEVLDVEGLTARGLIVPFDQETDVVDLTPDGPIAYREVFRAGSCLRAVDHPDRVGLIYTHEDNFTNALGQGVTMTEEKRGLVGDFRLYPSTADKARDVLTSSHSGLSAGFVSIKPRHGSERPGTLVERIACAILHVAAVPQGAYAMAGVESIREALDEADAEAEAEERAEAEKRRQQMAELDAWLAEQRAMTFNT